MVSNENRNRVIDRAVDFSSLEFKNRQIEIRTSLSTKLPLINGDPVRIEQVFLNLLTNSRYALDKSERGEKWIHIVTQLQKGDKTGSPESILVMFQDNGIGMPDDHAERVFQSFFSTKIKEGGTGNGLSIVKRVLDDHKAIIRVESKPDLETTFWINLPT